MKIRNILKKDIVIIFSVVLLILLLTIGAAYAKTIERKNVIILDKKVVAQETSSQPITVQIDEQENEVKVIQAERTNEQLREYYIKVNYQMNTVTVYIKDQNGEYTVPYKVFVCSCGEDTPTSGVYYTSDKYEWRALVGNVYGQYATRIVGSILFHSVPYEKMDKSSLEYWEYDKLGETASAGCVRLKVSDAKWIYDNCSKGTKVEFYASSDPGPLGKPEVQKISDKEQARNWDPTDVSPNNPWFDTNEN